MALFCGRGGYGVAGGLLEAQLCALMHSSRPLIAAAVAALAAVLPRAPLPAVAAELPLGLASALPSFRLSFILGLIYESER